MKKVLERNNMKFAMNIIPGGGNSGTGNDDPGSGGDGENTIKD